MKDKQYMVSEEELFDYLNDIRGIGQLGYEVIKEVVANFLKSKKSVDILDSDNVKQIIDTTITAYQYGVDEINEIAYGEARADKDGSKTIAIDDEFTQKWKSNRESAIDYGAEKICELIPKQFNEKEIETIIEKYDDGIHQDMGIIIPYKDMPKFVKELSQLQPESEVVAEGELFEKLADIEHSRWAGWQKYLHSKCTKDKDGNLIIPAGYVENLERKIKASYSDLTEQEKESDRVEVRKYWGLIHKCKESNDRI